MPFGIASGKGALAYADLTNSLIEFDPMADNSRKPSISFNAESPSEYVWYNYSHKEAKVFTPTNTLASLSSSRFVSVKYTNSLFTQISFDAKTGEASITLNVELDD